MVTLLDLSSLTSRWEYHLIIFLLLQVLSSQILWKLSNMNEELSLTVSENRKYPFLM